MQNPLNASQGSEFKEKVLTIYTNRSVNEHVMDECRVCTLSGELTDAGGEENQDGAPAHFVMKQGGVAPLTQALQQHQLSQRCSFGSVSVSRTKGHRGQNEVDLSVR